MKRLEVLFYEDPLTDQSAFMWRSPHIQCDAPWLLALMKSGADARMLTHKRFTSIARAEGIPRRALFLVDEASVIAKLWDANANINSLFHRNFDSLTSQQQMNSKAPADLALARAASGLLGRVVARALGDFDPDIIVTWAPAPHLRILFPEALILHKETCVFTRRPFSVTYYLDPLGFHRWSAPAQIDEPAINVSDEASSALRRLRARLGHAFDRHDNVRDLRARTPAGVEVILVATQTNGVFSFDAACNYRSQAHMVLDVLENAPADSVVVVSQHPDCRLLSAAEIAYLRERYANFVYWPELLARRGSGQHLVRNVDRVATVSSSVGLQALFWSKPLYALGNSHLNRFAAGQGAASLRLARGSNVFSEANAAWLVYNYSYPNELCKKPGWLYEHLRGRVEHWRRSGAENYYRDPIASPDELTEILLTK